MQRHHVHEWLTRGHVLREKFKRFFFKKSGVVVSAPCHAERRKQLFSGALTCEALAVQIYKAVKLSSFFTV